MRSNEHVSPSLVSAIAQPMSRRDLLTRSAKLAAGAAAFGIALPGARPAFAQDATPAADLSGYQELVVTITDDALSLSSTEISAGYLLLTVVNNASRGNGRGSADERWIHSTDSGRHDGHAAAAGRFPDLLFDVTIAGGPQDAKPGTSSQAIIRVTAGGWAVIADGNQAPSSSPSRQERRSVPSLRQISR